MNRRLGALVYRVFGVLPWFAQRLAISVARPAFVIGSTAVVVAADGRILLVRHTYKPGWSTPGGFVDRHEDPRDAVVREVWEECGIRCVAEGEAAVMVRGDERIVEFIYALRPVDDGSVGAARPVSGEISQVRWFAPDDLPSDLSLVAYNGINALAATQARIDGGVGVGATVAPIDRPAPPPAHRRWRRHL